VLDLGPRVFVETGGEKGSYTITAKERFHTPAFQIDIVDTTGAGDVYHGAYIAGLLRGWDLSQIALFSSAVSALKCTKLGGRAGIPTFGETLAFLHTRGIELRYDGGQDAQRSHLDEQEAAERRNPDQVF
jgi:sugar/nucleoside kinase (ribokinase family)